MGLLVGQRRSEASDLAVFLARTPNASEDQAQGPVPDDEPIKTAAEVLSDVSWMEEHVKQVSRMLPGIYTFYQTFQLYILPC